MQSSEYPPEYEEAVYFEAQVKQFQEQFFQLDINFKTSVDEQDEHRFYYDKFLQLKSRFKNDLCQQIWDWSKMFGNEKIENLISVLYWQKLGSNSVPQLEDFMDRHNASAEMEALRGILANLH